MPNFDPFFAQRFGFIFAGFTENAAGFSFAMMDLARFFGEIRADIIAILFNFRPQVPQHGAEFRRHGSQGGGGGGRGLTSGRSVTQTERDLKRLFPREHWNQLHLRIIFYGREYCTARGCDGTVCPLCREVHPGRRRAVRVRPA